MAKLNAKGRKQVKSSNFAVPKGSPVGGRGKAKYPIHDLKHARNALSRVAQHGSAAEKRMVRAAVRRKYPALAKRSRALRGSRRR